MFYKNHDFSYNKIMKIENIEFKNNLILAPMAGVTDVGFKYVAINNGADCAVSEMVSAKALKYNNKKTLDLLCTAPNEKIKIVQIFGSDPKIMASIIKSKHLKDFDIIDINMGCPAPKIVKNGEGCALMKNIKLAEEIITACVNATAKPITVKFRSGWDDESVNAVEFAKMCERAGAKAITIHGRTREQFYGGCVNLDIIKQVKQAVNIPVIGNGDVYDSDSFKHMMEYTNCDAVMVGRATLGKPWVFAEILNIKKNASDFENICDHINILSKYYPENFIVKHMRKHMLWYIKGFRNANAVKAKVSVCNKVEDMINAVRPLFMEN